jgi:hypothetical protein
LPSAWKKTISSTRLRNSGRKCCRSASVTWRRTPSVGSPGVLGDELAPEVRRHDHDRVLEVHGAPLAVGQPPVVEQLQHDVQHLGCAFSISSKSTTE